MASFCTQAGIKALPGHLDYYPKVLSNKPFFLVLKDSTDFLTILKLLRIIK